MLHHSQGLLSRRLFSASARRGMEQPPALGAKRAIVCRTGTKSPAIVFQQIAVRWALNPRALFRSALDCSILKRSVRRQGVSAPEVVAFSEEESSNLFEGEAEHVQPEIELLARPGVTEITYSRRIHPQADNYPDVFDSVTLDLLSNRCTLASDAALSKPPLSFLYSCVHSWGLEYVPLNAEDSQRLALELITSKSAVEERKQKLKDDKRAATEAAKPAPVLCRHGAACPSKDPKHMAVFTHPDDAQRRDTWSQRAKEQFEERERPSKKKKAQEQKIMPDLPVAAVQMWVDYRQDYMGTEDYSARIEGVASNFLERFIKFASREVIGGTIYEKFAHFDRLIQKEHFRNTYKRLKQKYQHWVSVFADEKDNPIKYVFEDVGIAAHLVCLWEIDAKDKGLKEKQSFVDLGCGNGFLVHILNSEGYRGRGIDLKRRKIWAKFGPETAAALLEVDFHPNSASFPDTDWLVGNHSDELTPWIPYLASKSGPRTNFFVLPCCFFDFDVRFQANHGKVGAYKTYLNYIQSIGEAAGFVVETEPLRIPSTKNIALIGRKHSYDVKDAEAAQAMEVRREKLLETKKVATMKLRNEREAEHRDSRKRRRDTVLAVAREKSSGASSHSDDESHSFVEAI